MSQACFIYTSPFTHRTLKSFICKDRKFLKVTQTVIYKTEIDSPIQKTNLWFSKGKCGGRDKLGVLELKYTHYRI